MKDPTELLYNIVSKASGFKRDIIDGPWEFREGVKIFIDPPALCPLCNEWIPTRRIWLVDDKNSRLVGSWDLRGNRINWDKYGVHPHVAYDGRVCLRDSKISSDSLFACLTPGVHYHSTELWFWELGHDCPEVEKYNCAVCKCNYIPSFTIVYGNNYLTCSRKCYHVAVDFRCRSCFAERDLYEPFGRGGLCISCFNIESLQCDFCEGRVLPRYERRSRANLIVCISCRPNHNVECGRCEREFPHSELDNSLRCPNCSKRDGEPIDRCNCETCRIARGEARCDDCGEWTLAHLLLDDLCEGCRDSRDTIYCYHCEETEVDEEGDRCGSCCCSYCGEEVVNDSSYCRDHHYQCECDCDCKNRISIAGSKCNFCIDVCLENEDDEE